MIQLTMLNVHKKLYTTNKGRGGGRRERRRGGGVVLRE